MLFDTHMHADYSCDAEMTLQGAMEAAEKLGVGIILTEHWDRDYPTNPESFIFDINDYFQKDGPFRSERVLLGIEVGLQPHTIEADRKMTASHPFDEVVGSMHCFQHLDMYEPTTYEGLTKAQAVTAYLEDSVACLMQKPDFDTYGHIDYICRYMPYPDPNLHYEDNPALWDKVFQLLIEQDKTIEINTRRLGDAAVLPPLLQLYKRYYQLGGRYASLGSDAHYVEHVGRDFAVAERLAKEAGLTLVYYKNRRRQLCR